MYGGYESGHRYHNIFSVCSGLLFYYESITSSNVPVINKAHFKYGVDQHLNLPEVRSSLALANSKIVLTITSRYSTVFSIAAVVQLTMYFLICSRRNFLSKFYIYIHTLRTDITSASLRSIPSTDPLRQHHSRPKI